MPFNVHTNPVESITPALERSPKQGAFPNGNAPLKVLYIHVKELNWKTNMDGGHIQNWAIVMNLIINDQLEEKGLDIT